MPDTSLPTLPARRETDGFPERRAAGHRAELDLALGLMQKRLGAEQMVAKDGDVKPDAKPKVVEDPELKGGWTSEKPKLMRKEIEEFEQRVDDAEKAATARRNNKSMI